MKKLLNTFYSHNAVRCLCVVALLLVTKVTEAQKENLTANVVPAGNVSTLTDKQKSDVEDLLNTYDQKIYFTENKGQWPGNVLYKADFHLGQAIATKDGMLVGTFDPADVAARDAWSIREEESIRRGVRLQEPGGNAKGHGWLMSFVNHSANMTIETKDKHTDVFNYFSGNATQTGVNNYQEVWYKNVYNNVDVRYYPSKTGTLEYDIVCKPGFNKNEIAIQLQGIKNVTVAKDAHLVFKTTAGDMDFPAPVAYQKDADKKQIPVKVKYYVTDDNVLHFTLGDYDESKTLIIDPIALRWATWITNNSADADHGHCIWIDPSDGGIYVVTRFGGAGLITTDAFQNSYAGGSGDDFVIGKYYEPSTEGGSGTRVWQTYLGGTGEDNPYAITQGLDSAIYITGYTASTNFPMIGGTKFGTVANGINESSQITSSHYGIVVTKIWKDGQSIKSSVVAGNGENYSFDIGMDSNGDMTICGFTSSTNLHTLFPSTNASNTNNGDADVLVFQLTSNFETMNWMRNYGGSGREVATILQQNPVTNEIYLAGYTTSSNFPVSSNARQSTLAGKLADGFLQKLSSTGNTIWSSYFNSASGDSTVILCMEFNSTYNKLYFGGLTTGLGTNNTPSGTYQTKIGGGQDFFCASIDTNQTFVASTYIGGSGNEVNMMGLNVDLNNDVYIFGYTPSTNFPVTPDAIQSTNLGDDDKVFLKLHTDLTSLVFSTYYGGSNDDYDPVGERGIKFSNCRIYTIVTSESNNIPLTTGAITTNKLSSSSVYEPGIVEWANPPDLANNTITTSQIICPGNTPVDLVGSVPSYSLPTISRNGTTSAYPVTLPSATTYQWQTSTDSINWSSITGGTTQNLSGSLIGAVYQKTFIRRIIGGDACIVADAADQLITIKTISLAAAIVSNNICATDKNGSITVTVSNGTAPYTYTWSNGATTESITSLTPGNYTITATDQGGCSRSATYSISGSTAIVPAPTATATTCGLSNGAAGISATGGASPYAYSWSNNVTGSNISGLAANTYSVVITDAQGCTATASANVAASAPPVVSVNNATICNGNSASLTAGGASTYTWAPNTDISSPAGVTISANPSSTTTYTVTGTDVIGCTSTATSTVTVNALPIVSINGASTICSYGSASLQANASAGSGAITSYQWQLNSGNISGATNSSYNTATAGTYSLIVTNSNNCSASNAATFTLTQATALSIQSSVTNANCNGDQNGAVDITVSGSLPGYTYNWSNNATTQDISGVAAGNYAVTVTDSYGCTAASQTFNISQPAILSINGNATITSASCNGDQNGSINITVNGGTPSYTYSWSNGASSQNISGVGAGSYSVTITDAHGCSVSNSYAISEPQVLAIDANAVIIANANCNSDQNGSINITVNGGTPSYIYSWSNGASSQNISGVGAGNYSVTITDAHGCSVSNSYTISEPQVLAIDANAVVIANANCNGDQNGSINITVNGGTPSYTYSWSNGASSQNISGLGAGSYSVTIADAHGCSVSNSYSISEPQVLAIDANAVVIANANCNGDQNGSINITVNGGTPSYTYSWSNGALTQNISGIGAGNYSVTITDAHDCSVSNSYTISQPTVLSIDTNAVITGASCNGQQNGAISINIEGGSPAYTYSWDNGATTQNISSLTAGNFTVTVTDSHNCSVSQPYTVSQPSTLSIDANGVVTTNANCNGDQNGSIDITINGGLTPYTYSWNNGATTQNVSGLGAGNYSVTIADAHNCSVSNSYTISEPQVLAIDANAVVVSNANCNGDQNGSINITVNGGTPSYTYSWSNGALTQNISGLGAGSYSVTITDAHGCSVSNSYSISEPQVLAIDANAVVVANANCNGDQNGSINITVNGGTPSYTYSWSNGALTQNISGLGAGSYSVTITDAHGCSVSNSYSISEPQVLAIDANAVVVANANCNGDQNGSINITVNGGTPSYTYSWSNGALTQNISGLGAGSYSVTITDAHGCSVSNSYSISEPQVLAIDANAVIVANANCNGDQNGSINITVNGGSPSYTYSWSNGALSQNISGLGAGSYSVTITDAHGCSVSNSYTISEPQVLAIDANAVVVANANCNGDQNGSINISVNGGTPAYTYSWSNDALSQNISGLGAGSYSVTITDAHGCSVSNSYTISEPQVLAIDANAVVVANANCNGDENGSINITINGGTPSYTYSWSNGASSQNISGLGAGNYSVTITDAHGCSVSNSYTISEPQVLAIDANAVVIANANCNGDQNGSINITVNGGTPSYTYSWSNGALTQNISGLGAGSYSVTITDAHSCSVSNSYTISEPQVLAIDANAVVIANANCNGDQNGSINISVNGGTPSYTYSWSNGASSQNISGLGAGNYSVTITDAHGCSVSNSYTVSQPTQLSVSGSITDAACSSAPSGAISITVQGGSPDYTYSWSTGDTTQNISGIGASDYTLTLTDSHGCSLTQTFTVNQPSTLAVSGSATDANCNGDQNGSVSLTVTGGSQGYIYDWNNGATTENISGLNADIYTVKVTDSHGCNITESFTVNQPTQLTVTGSATDANCNGDQNGAVNINANGGSAGYTYNWSNDSLSQNISALTAGSYAITVTDAHNCTASQSFTVNEPTQLTVIGSAIDANCNGDQNGAVNINANGGSAGYTYNWTNDSLSQNISALVAGSYAITVTDAHSCTVSQSFTVNQPTQLTVIGSATDANCNGDQNGAVNITANGGSAGYTYNWSNDSLSQNISALTAGSYAITVTDAHSCTASQSFTVNQPTQLTITGSATDANCNGDQNGGVNITANGGSAGYTYNWSNDSLSQNISTLIAGSYAVTVTDAHSCTVSQSFTVNQPTQLTVIGSAIDANCNGYQNGSVNINANGGSAGYTYNWSNDSLSQNISTLIAGSYAVTVTDAHSCTASQSFTVNQPTQLTVIGSAIDANCNGDQNGAVNITPNGGSPAYNYAWSDEEIIQNISSLTAGIYSVTVTDSHTCSVSQSFTVNQPSQLTVDGSATDAKCNGNNNGSIDINVNGGTGTYTYNWSNGESVEDISNLSANNYAVTVSDAHSCSVNKSFSVAQPAQLTISDSTIEADCSGNGGGAVNITVNGGNPDYTYSWDNGANTENISDVAAGGYTVTVTDTKGCSASDLITVSYPKTKADAGPDVKIDCSSGSVQLDAQGQGTWTILSGQGSLSSDTAADATLSNVPKNVSVILIWTVTNQNCSSTDTVTADACRDTALFIPTGFSPNGDGVNDYFVIKGLDKYPDNSLMVFNRWGNGVYSKKNYDNQWGGGDMSGEPLPDGTYFVIFTSSDNGGVKYASYVDLRRK